MLVAKGFPWGKHSAEWKWQKIITGSSLQSFLSPRGWAQEAALQWAPPLLLWLPLEQYLIQRGSGQLSAAQRGNVPHFPIYFAIKRSQPCCRGIAVEPRAKFAIPLCQPAAFSLIFNDYKLPYSWGFGKINNVCTFGGEQVMSSIFKCAVMTWDDVLTVWNPL